MNPLWIGLLCLIAIYVVYRLIAYYFSPKIGNRVGAEQIDLSKQTQVVASEELKNAWTSNAGSTLTFYILPEIKDRTSVAGNEYANVVQIGSKQIFQLFVAPDASRGDSVAPAQLLVYVKGSTVPDIVEIPNVPLQRWSAVTIVKQSRKINVYVNGTISASHMCTAMPDFDTTQPLRTGDVRLSGTIALMSLDPYPLDASSVKSLVESAVDTSGKPYIASGSSFPIPTISDFTDMIGCPGGNCNTPKKTGPMETWSSPYA